jgi:hypothetical protein
MKPINIGPWALDSDARYARTLSAVCGSGSADAMNNKPKIVSPWLKSKGTLRLATAYSLQPIIWRSAQ